MIDRFNELLDLLTDEQLIRLAYRARKRGNPELSEDLHAELARREKDEQRTKAVREAQ